MIAPVRIPTNSLLRSVEPTLGLDEILASLQLSALADGAIDGLANVADAGETLIRRIHDRYGAGALFRLMFLAMGHERDDFRHFLDIVRSEFSLIPVLSTLEPVDLVPSNASLPAGRELARFNSNLLVPSLARKLYNPGRHPGYLVYGLGGPKILVSHPFRGAKGELYDVYANSVDVVTSLMMRGFAGTFLFFDYLPGLNDSIKQVPAWLVWFSMVAAHSDLVVFVKAGADLSPSQKREADLTPDRVHKTIFEIPEDELRWASVHENYDPDLEHIYIDPDKGLVTREEWYAIEREHAQPMLEQYVSPGFPSDRLIQIGESGSVKQYPLDFPAYGDPTSAPASLARTWNNVKKSVRGMR